METYVSKIEISREMFNKINKLMEVDFDDVDENGDLKPEMERLINELDARRNTMFCMFHFNFADNSTIVIKIVCGQHNYYDDCIWSNGKDYYELDSAFGIEKVNEFIHNDKCYICKFIIKEN